MTPHARAYLLGALGLPDAFAYAYRFGMVDQLVRGFLAGAVTREQLAAEHARIAWIDVAERVSGAVRASYLAEEGAQG